MRFFTMSECTHSETALKNRIDNTPNEEHKAHIVEAIETLVDPLREAWERHCLGKGLGNPQIRISSGYRSPALNAQIHGSATSAHCHGYAFDLIPANGKMLEFKRFCRTFLTARAFDQLISEKENDKGVPNWMHVGYKHPNGSQRKQCLSMTNNKYYPMTD